jgi:DNA-3-methyladenine glycosylase
LSLLPREFFDRPVLTVAPELLGCLLLAQSPDGAVAVALTEVEAYAGEADPASHAFRGQTPRTTVMFGEPGHAYVYFTYGMHFCVNLVCQPAGTAAAVLLRAGRVIEGTNLAAVRRGATAGRKDNELARGPARLCQALGIDRSLNGIDVCDPASPLRILQPSGPGRSLSDPGLPPSGPGLPSSRPGRSLSDAGLPSFSPGRSLAGQVDHGPRVGVSRAADVAWRFWIAADPTVSAYRRHVPRSRKTAVTSAPADGSMQR